MEDGLRVDRSEEWVKKQRSVLILVLMEDGLRGATQNTYDLVNLSLNPCFNGRWSARFFPHPYNF